MLICCYYRRDNKQGVCRQLKQRVWEEPSGEDALKKAFVGVLEGTFNILIWQKKGMVRREAGDALKNRQF